MIDPKKHCPKIPCVSSDIDDLPDKIGVYGFLQRSSGQWIYIGKTEKQTIRQRVKQHWKDSMNQTGNKLLGQWIKNYNKLLDISYVPMERKEVHCVDSLETMLIQRWNPPANTNKKQPKNKKEQNHGHDCCRNEG